MQPSLFISHGAPNVVIVPSEVRTFLSGLSKSLKKPEAIVIASAHFETDEVEIVSDPSPKTIYDFGGFEPELYTMEYPAKGSPRLAEAISGEMKKAGLACSINAKRGFDHGVWTPMMLAFPNADIPIVQVSVQPNEDATHHYNVGKALAHFRKQNILVIGSGHITHNLREVFSAMQGRPVNDDANKMIKGFVSWIEKKLQSGEKDALLDWENQAPDALFNHPSPEHFMPLFVAYGAGLLNPHEKPAAQLLHRSTQFGIFTSDIWRFD